MNVLNAPGVGLEAAALLALRPAPDPAGQAGVGAVPGPFRTARRGQGSDIADLRAYAHGDDLRHLDPGATARTGELHVRAFHQDSDLALVLIADFRRPMLWGLRRAFRSVAAAEALVIAGWQAVDRGEKLGVAVLRDGSVAGMAPTARPDTMSCVVGLLCAEHAAALAAPGAPQSLSDGLEKIAHSLPRHARLLLATGGEEPGDLRVIQRLADRHDLRVLRMGTGLENGLPAGRYPVLGQPGAWDGVGWPITAPLCPGVLERPLDPAQPPAPMAEAAWQRTA